MARKKKSRATKDAPGVGLIRRTQRILRRIVLYGVLLVIALFALLRFVNPPFTHTMWAERRSLGQIERTWVPMEEISPDLRRAVVAAEDANFCEHWGFDMSAIRTAIEEGANRGASTLTQQTVKNVFLWQGRSWVRKALEAVLTPMAEIFWPKRRILEIYLNVAEFDEGRFGAEAAAQGYFGKSADALTLTEASRLAAVLPNPKARSASNPSARLRARATSIADGARTIERDGRAACFED